MIYGSVLRIIGRLENWGLVFAVVICMREHVSANKKKKKESISQ
jgi:hypothetical protein